MSLGLAILVSAVGPRSINRIQWSPSPLDLAFLLLRFCLFHYLSRSFFLYLIGFFVFPVLSLPLSSLSLYAVLCLCVSWSVVSPPLSLLLFTSSLSFLFSSPLVPCCFAFALYRSFVFALNFSCGFLYLPLLSHFLCLLNVIFLSLTFLSLWRLLVIFPVLAVSLFGLIYFYALLSFLDVLVHAPFSFPFMLVCSCFAFPFSSCFSFRFHIFSLWNPWGNRWSVNRAQVKESLIWGVGTCTWDLHGMKGFISLRT